MDFGVLPKVDRRQVEAKNLHRAHQSTQAATGQVGATVQLQRIGQNLQISAQGFRRGIGRGLTDFMANGLNLIQHAGGGSEASVDAGQGAAVGLVGTLR